MSRPFVSDSQFHAGSGGNGGNASAGADGDAIGGEGGKGGDVQVTDSHRHDEVDQSNRNWNIGPSRRWLAICYLLCVITLLILYSAGVFTVDDFRNLIRMMF